MRSTTLYTWEDTSACVKLLENKSKCSEDAKVGACTKMLEFSFKYRRNGFVLFSKWFNLIRFKFGGVVSIASIANCRY